MEIYCKNVVDKLNLALIFEIINILTRFGCQFGVKLIYYEWRLGRDKNKVLKYFAIME